jgi:dynactin-5
VNIGAGSVVGKFVIIKDCVKVLEGSVIPQGTVIPSFSIVGGRPARVIDEMPETGQEMMDLREVYRKI